jgi:hypothetical protein
MLQVGQGLPSGRTIDIPNGTNSTEILLPGPPAASGTVTRKMPKVWDDTTSAFVPASVMTAVIPGTGLGPTINGVATDLITIVLADGAFLSTDSGYDVYLTKLCTSPSPNSITVDPGVDISNGGADDLHTGDLIMLMKGSATTLVEITAVDGVQTASFASNDALNLNQTTAVNGTFSSLVALAPADTCTVTSFQSTTATRIRMISYYIDTVSDPTRPRLVRRINNGDAVPTSYTNSTTSGTPLAFDVDNLQVSYDLVDGVNNPAGVRFTTADLNGTGACSPNPCSPNQIRKINVTLWGRSRTPLRQTKQYLRNSLSTQVSLRSMSFIDRYK